MNWIAPDASGFMQEAADVLNLSPLRMLMLLLIDVVVGGVFVDVVVVVVVIVVVVVSGAVVIKTCFYFDLLNLKILPRDISAAKIAESLLRILRVISNTNPDGAEIV